MREKKVVIPENVKIDIQKLPEGVKVVVEGEKGKVEKLFKSKRLEIKIENGEVKVSTPRKEMINTVKSIISWMIEGVQNPFVKKMKILYAHFPVNVEVKGDEVIFKNFLGEKKPRVAKIIPGVNVKVNGQIIELTSSDKEALGNMVHRLKTTLKIKAKDPRVFQDGVYEVIE